jgi:glc operon protein GlcG
MYQTSNISHGEALAMITAVKDAAEKAGKAVCAAVADSHGELLAFLRMDGCQIPSVYIAQNKAFTAARERKPSGEVGSNVLASGHPMSNYGDIRYTAWQGGLPVVHDGKVIGGIGVSGLSGEEDEELAGKGRAAIAR